MAPVLAFSSLQFGSLAQRVSATLRAGRRKRDFKTFSWRLWALAFCGFAVLACGKDAQLVDPIGPDPDNGPPQLSASMENALPGDPGWYTAALADQNSLAVWAAPYSVRTGDTLSIHIHALHGPVKLSIYRLGWYDGTGGRLMWSATDIGASAQPACSVAFPGPVVCPWSRTTWMQIGTDFTSGVYLLKVTDSESKSALYPFVVRPRRRAMFTAVVPQLTWQAYNNYGGSSLYTVGPDGKKGHLISFERPYDYHGGAGYLYGLGYSNDISVLMWLEREGIDVSYVSDIDVSSLGRRMQMPTKGLLFIGHDEYWTLDQFDAVTRFRDAGTHLFFFAGNPAYWRVRMSASPITSRANQVVACYKNDPDPEAPTANDRTSLFRLIGRPENALVGTGYVQHAYGGPYPIIAADSGAVASDPNKVLDGAAITAGDTLSLRVDRNSGEWPPLASLEGNEIMQNGATPAGTRVLFRMPYTGGVKTPQGVFESTFYRAPSGAGVFSSGFNEWGRFLSGHFGPEDPRISRATRAVLNWMSKH